MVEYTDLVKQSSRLSGYYREKMEKKIQVLAKSILENKDVRHKIMQQNPMVMKQITASAKSLLNKCIDIC